MNGNSWEQTLEALIDGSESTRYHITRTHAQQNIADHSFGVAWLCMLFCDGKPSAQLLIAALRHDIAEYAIGDIPSPTKRLLGDGFRESLGRIEEQHAEAYFGPAPILTDAEEKWLRLADAMECLLFCIREIRVGNSNMKVVFGRANGYVTDVTNSLRFEHPAVKIHMAICNLFAKVSK